MTGNAKNKRSGCTCSDVQRLSQGYYLNAESSISRLTLEEKDVLSISGSISIHMIFREVIDSRKYKQHHCLI